MTLLSNKRNKWARDYYKKNRERILADQREIRKRLAGAEGRPILKKPDPDKCEVCGLLTISTFSCEVCKKQKV